MYVYTYKFSAYVNVRIYIHLVYVYVCMYTHTLNIHTGRTSRTTQPSESIFEKDELIEGGSNNSTKIDNFSTKIE